MLKNALIGVSLFAVLLLAALSFLTARYIDQEEIARARLELAQMRASRDSLAAVDALRDSMQAAVQHTIDGLQEEAEELRDQVAELERRRQQERLAVRRIWEPDSLKRKFDATFPAVARSSRVIEIVNEETGLGLEYLAVPRGFEDTFIIDHQDAESYRQQIGRLSMVDSLQAQVVAYKDSLFALERERALAWEAGYYESFDNYEALNRKYVRLLEQPPAFEVFPNRRGMWISGAVGVVAGVAAMSLVK